MVKNKFEKHWAEENIESLLEKISGGWEFVEFRDDETTLPQAKYYVAPRKGWFSYPDFRKINSKKEIILFLEVKGYIGWYDNIDFALGITKNQLNSYHFVEINEGSPVRIVFLIKNTDGSVCYYWESLESIKSMEFYKKTKWDNRKKKNLVWCYFDARDFQTDIENMVTT